VQQCIQSEVLTGMNTAKYRMSFTTGGLFHRESVKLAMLYDVLKDWDTVRNKALSDNLLQARTQESSKRICPEIISRLTTLDPKELDVLVNGNVQEQMYILWLAVCRLYAFIGEFALEVLRERYVCLKGDIRQEDFDSFFNRKSEWCPELDTIQPSTKAKLRQVLFKMLREADLLTAGGDINPATLSPRLLQTLASSRRKDILFFPVFDSDVKGWSP
jgi:hypothetical protein